MDYYGKISGLTELFSLEYDVHIERELSPLVKSASVL